MVKETLARRRQKRNTGAEAPVAREEGFEPPTNRFVAWYSIQLSYSRLAPNLGLMAEREGFEPSVGCPTTI